MDLSGKVAVVTGAGAGLGRAEAVELARAGASLVLNDLPGAADAAAAEIEELGAKCVVVEGDVGERSTADALVTAAVEQFGGLHVVVNNAGVLRDRMLFNMSDEDWDLVMRVHLRGHFLLSRNAVSLWRQQSKATGEPVYGRVINTSSEAFLLGSEGQANYAAAKAGIAALTVATARGTGRYGVRANAICPRARTGMTAHVFGDAPDGTDPLAPEHVAKFVAYLASPPADKISGQVFVVHGGMVALMAPPTVEHRFDAIGDLDGYFADRDPQRTFSCTETMGL
ncbi:3-oxoacyl-ACP reductase [Lentzea sp. NPDC051213]|uniref:3-oxoacyl-ACP reductase n=1 Tax=Lentzea sp. NPDC051213 TaxID=3364126 RepID=UPI00379C1D6F